VFVVPETSCPLAQQGRPRHFRDPAGLAVLQRIAEGLTESGYPATTAKPGYAVEAGLRCRLGDGFDVTVCLAVAERKGGFVEFELGTYHSPSLLSRIWRGRSGFDAQHITEWKRLCSAINDQIVQRVGAASVAWLTFEAAAARWKVPRVSEK
jgi:hypothetical protein